ncbi:MAG: SGNH/GDSL hydrolase family protein [Algoriphagus sp.]|jgi:lysophospholipase L1-like esterase|nr:SGNH/GDSL hydrolase family protein [Algoriphagus sp.]MCE2779202.1 SGNH/GDSL hydrolase family protein [Algoriphagus sp.]
MYLLIAKRMSSVYSFSLALFLFIAMTFSTPNQAQTTSLSYLALGDSYTIGEGVGLEDRYPMQLVREWNKSAKIPFSVPLIIAKTGWTVDELEAGIQATPTEAEGYDLVTLLIGVNNQYRGRSVESFAVDFEKMLQRAIAFAKGNKSRVIVISIPDWGVTPFAVQKGVEPDQVAKAIDAYNRTKKEICEKQGIKFIDITDDYRMDGGLSEGVVEDQLHPSKLIYGQWTSKLLSELKKINF